MNMGKKDVVCEKRNNNYKWYILRVQTGQDLKVKEWIENNAAKFFQNGKLKRVYVPQKSVFIYKNGKNILKEQLKMPGYVYIEAELDDVDIDAFLRSSPFYIMFVGRNMQKDSDNIPCLNNKEVEVLLQDEVGNTISNNEEFSVGEDVKIVDGVFSGFNGIIQSINLKNNSAKINVNIFSRSIEVELFLTQISKQ